MTVLPFPPSGELTSSIEFATRVFSTYEGEQRLSRRPKPRLVMSIGFELFGREIGEAREISRRVLATSGVIKIPDWRYASLLSVTSGQTVFNVGAMASLYVIGSEAIVWQGSRDFFVATIGAVSPTEVTLTSGPTADMSSARVAPLRAGVSGTGLSIDPLSSGYATGRLSATLQGYPDLSGSAVPESYEGVELFTARRYKSGDLSDTVERAHTIVDSGTGPIVAIQDRDFTSGRLSLSLEEDTPEAILAREEFMHRRRGRAVPFFVATDTIDLVPIGGTNGGTITVADDLTTAELLNRRLILRAADGTSTATTVIGATDNLDGTLSLSVSPPLPTLTPIEISSLSELALARLASDTIEIRSGFDGTSRINVPVRRLDNEL